MLAGTDKGTQDITTIITPIVKGVSVGRSKASMEHTKAMPKRKGNAST
jgi:hypothetical protein